MTITMRYLSYLTILMISAFLAACGGGGGAAVTPGTSGTPGTAVDTRLSVQLKDSNGVAIQSIPASASAEVVAILTTTEGLPAANQVIKVSDFSALVFYPNGNSAKTDANGVAKIKVNRTTATKFGSGIFSITFDGLCNPTCSSQKYFSSSNSIGYRVDPPAFKLELFDSDNQITNSISTSGYTSLKATLKFEDGTPVNQKRVEVTGDLKKVAFPEGTSQLTNSSGVAIIKVTRASLNVNGAGTLNAATTISGPASTGAVDATVVTGMLDFTVGVANIALIDLNTGSTPLAAFGNRPISVKATINGLIATNTSIPITFNANCGTTSPASVTTDASGIATTTYTASAATCSGTNVSISASTAGAAPISGIIEVASSVATNIQFISATPQLIYLKDSVGTTQAQVVFKVVDSSGNPLQNKKLRLSLSNIATGITLDTMGNNAPVDLTSNNLGLVSAAVFSGTVPTSLNVKATLLDNNNLPTSIFSNSNLLTVASGRPTQRSLSLSVGKLSIEGFNTDGQTTTVTLAMADRQGNPVPPGTQVNFVSESGVLLPAVCFVPPVIPATESSPAIPSSSCTVNILSSGTRTASGRVSILAYVVGEEDFVDINGNNIYDASDTFTDLGRAFRDDNGQTMTGANGIYDAGEFQVPRVGASACVAGSGCLGDGIWGAADVRKQATIVFASSQAMITGAFQPAIGGIRSGFDFVVADTKSNSMPTGSTVSVSVVDLTTVTNNCSLVGTDKFTVANSIFPIALRASFKECTAGDIINVKVTAPSGFVTSQDFVVPTDPLTTTAGTEVTLGIGQQQLFQPIGGIAPYSYSSNNNTIATADHGLLGGFNTLYINALKAGIANIFIKDAVGTTTVIKVTVQ